MPVAITPSLLFKTAALINAICVPGHILFGRDTVHPALGKIKLENRKSKVGHASATASYNYVNGALAILAFLNWQWARTGGPKSFEEKAILLTTVVNGFIDGLTYFNVGEYGPLSVMWVAPAASVAGFYLSP